MAKLQKRLWRGSVLLTAVALVVSACADNDTTPSPGKGGAGGSGGEFPTAGQGGSAHAGASAGDAGNAGNAGNGGSVAQGGQGGGPGCVDGLQVIKVVDGSSLAIVSWPNEHRVGVSSSGQGVSIYELGDDGEVTLVETLGPGELGLTADGAIYSFTRFGDGFLVHGVTGAERPEPRIVNWQPGAELETVPYPGSSPNIQITAADPEIGIAARTEAGIRLATLESGTWTWSDAFAESAWRSRPLALEEGRMLVGIEERDRISAGGAGNAGGGGAGNAGGGAGGDDGDDVPTNPAQARVEWWTLEGQRLASHQAVGTPQVAVRVNEGWLIGETNSFWGSYQAAIELLPDTGALETLTRVPVISAADGTDGAYDLALLGSRLLVANCESGLRAGEWDTSNLELSSLPGPWQDKDPGSCSPRQVETQGDFAIIGGDRLVFARACE